MFNSVSPFILAQAVQPHPNYGYQRTPSCHMRMKSFSYWRQQGGADLKRENVCLWPDLFKFYPKWMYGLQGTGDCVSWALAHLLDVEMANAAAEGVIKLPPNLAASEAIYGFGKAELFNAYRWNGQGMMAIDAMRATRLFGVLYRQKYEKDDLREYLGKRAIMWGEYPRRTHGVPDYLERLALNHVTDEPMAIESLEDGALAIENGHPWIYCGDVRWGTRRGPDGYAIQFAYGSHAMTATAVRYEEGKISAFWIANTGHGDHVSGPIGDFVIPECYAACGSWVPAKIVLEGILQGDCYALPTLANWELNQEAPLDDACLN